jgi:hypothetical protein
MFHHKQEEAMYKKAFLLFFALFAGVLFAQAQSRASNTNQESALKFEKTEHNFGEIPQNVPAVYEFKFKNTSNRPVQIVSVKTSCGCTTPFYTKDPVAPKKSGVVKVSYNAARMGAFTKTITVTTSEGATIYLTIRGTVVANEQ